MYLVYLVVASLKAVDYSGVGTGFPKHSRSFGLQAANFAVEYSQSCASKYIH